MEPKGGLMQRASDKKVSIPFVRPLLPSLEDVAGEFAEILSSGLITKGKYLELYEHALQEHLGVRHVVCTSSCTTGLILALRCLPAGSEVIVPSFTFCATVHATVWNNLIPVFADCDPQTFNINPERVREAITDHTSAILGVHVFGNPADIDALTEIARQHNLKLFFDAAHGFGATYKGLPLGSAGDASVLSSSPTKLVVTGEGGAAATNDEGIARLIRVGREYGNPGDYDCEFAGLNARMNELNAVLGVKCLTLLGEAVATRRQLAATYQSLLGEVPGISFQQINPFGESSYNYFAIVIDPAEFGMAAEQLKDALEAQGIPSRRYFYPPVHRQKAYSELTERYDPKLPVTNHLSQNILCLPIHPHLSEIDVEGICEGVRILRKEKLDFRRALC